MASRFIRCFTAAVLSLIGCSVFAEPPALRDQVSLNGTWQYDGGSSITVPHESNNVFDRRTYTRSFQVPSGWIGKTITLDFEAVNHSCSVFVDNQFACDHIGAFVPFSANITSLVQPGNTYQLKLVVRGSRVLPTCDDLGPVWPIGKCGSETVNGAEAGMYDDVWLRAYGRIATIDAFAQTSYRTKTLRVDYTVKNFGNTAQTVTITGEVTPATGGGAVKMLQSSAVTVAPGDSELVVCETPWADAELWNPDHPYLYHLTTRLVAGGSTVDQEVRRFGFKEMWVVGNHFFLNGNRVNLYGENIVESEDYRANGRSAKPVWSTSIDKLKASNINYVRFHSHPTRSWVPEIADEKGMMLLEESALYARQYYNRGNVERVIDNLITHSLPEWIRAKRNHPSIVMWSSENEMLCYLALLSKAEVLEIEKAILQVDPTRPVTADGELDVGGMTYNCHYTFEGGCCDFLYTRPTIYGHVPSRLYPKPSGCGEFLTTWIGSVAEENQWWQGTLIRGLRYRNWTDIRPYQMGWTWVNPSSSARRDNQIRSWNKVALFDYEYDDLKLAPIRDGDYPYVDEGSTMARKLVVYNDEFSDPFVTITVQARQNSTVYATGTKTIRVPLGEHFEIPCTLQAPYTGSNGSTFEMVLRTSKAGVDRFAETTTYRLNDTGANGTPSGAITLDFPEVTDQSSPFIHCAPDTLYLRFMAGIPSAPDLLTVMNAGAGVLDNVSTSVEYLAGTPGWLSTERSGSGNGQIVESSYDVSNLAAGTYRADLTIAARNASNSSARCGIRMNVVEGREPDLISGVVPGLDYSAYEKDYERGEALGLLTQLTPVQTGVTPIPTVDVRTREDDFALRFTGYLRVTEPGEYHITLTSDEGSRMWIGTTLLVENAKWTNRQHSRTASVFLKPGYHAIAIDYCEESSFQGIRAFWEGPGIDGMVQIPESAYFRGDGSPVRTPARASNPAAFALQPIAGNHLLTLRFATPRASAVRIEVFDIAGRTAYVHSRGNLDAGRHETAVRLAPGHYFVRMKAGGKSLLSQVTMVR